MAKTKEFYLNFWYMALASERGIEIVTDNFDVLRTKLYSLRAAVKDTDLAGIAICVSPFDPNRLWLVKREPDLKVLGLEPSNAPS